MIVCKTPLRMSFVGGGSDIANFYRESEGAVLSTTINKYIYVSVNKKFDRGVRISYSKTENPDTIEEIKHPLVRHSLQHLGIKDSIEIASMADIPSKGSGLGSSSSYTVGLLNALYAFKEKKITKNDLAQISSYIEIDLCNGFLGKQDQYAAAFGGLNFIKFHKDDKVSVEPINCNSDIIKKFESSLIMFYTGKARKAQKVLKSFTNNILDQSKFKLLQRMVALSSNMKINLENNQLNEIGELLNENWQLKKQISVDVSDDYLDSLYQRGLSRGAIGGKILGAGGGGFILFFAPEGKHDSIIKEFQELRHIDFSFESEGSKIVYYE